MVTEYLAKECAEGRVLGPLNCNDFPQVHTSRFGVIPKGSTGKWRLIVDMSSPEGRSVNDAIHEAWCSLNYVGTKDAAREIVARGRGTLMAKVDVKSAYRNIPIHPDDRWMMGMLWDNSLFIDTALPFGLRSAPKIFSAIADAVEWIARTNGARCIMHYLDDFLVIGAPASQECQRALEVLLRVFNGLGLPVATEKLEGPVSHLTFLGFEIDSRTMEIRLPPQKLSELQSLCQMWFRKRSSTKRELESLVGKLSHASSVVPPGKTFMRRMFELLAVARRAEHHIRLGAPFRSDLCWWATFLGAWNGVAMLPMQSQGWPAHEFWTDASGSFSCGAAYPTAKQWIQLQWPGSCREGEMPLREESIMLKELLPVVLGLAVWGQRWHRAAVTVHCDNLGAVSVINGGYSRVPHIMHLLRCLFFIRAHFEITLRAVHVPGVQNTLADAISRNNVSYLFSQVEWATTGRVAIPHQVLDILVKQQPDWTSLAWTQELFSAGLATSTQRAYKTIII